MDYIKSNDCTESFSVTPYDKNLVTVDWDIITLCQYKCPYCYARKLVNQWSKMMTKNQIDIILNKISKINKKVDVNILGGEPTLHPNLNYILGKLRNMDNVRDITVFTNCVKPLNKFNLKEIQINASYHATENPDDEYFLNNIKNSNGIPFKITIMLVKNYEDKIEKFISKIKDYLPDTYIEPSYPVINDKPIVYNNSLNFIKSFLYNGKTYSYDDVIKGNLNNFKGWKCYTSFYAIKVDGDFFYSCFHNENIFNGGKFETGYEICKYSKCIHDCQLEQLKIK